MASNVATQDGSDVTQGSVTIGTMDIAAGIATFDSGSGAVLISTADALAAAITYLGAEVTDGNTVAFDYDISGTTGSYVFQGGTDGDVAVNLVGVATADLGADLDLV